MTLDEIWSDFTTAMAEVELMQRATRAATKNEMQRLLANEEVNHQLGGDGAEIVSMHNFSFKDLRSGRHIFYDHKDLSADEARHHLLLRQNRQYQWLLVEAYEAFEKFLVDIYAFVGATSQDCWPMKDYGNVTIAEAAQKTFPWYLEQAGKKKDLPHSVLTVLRKKFAGLSWVEAENYLKIHLGFAIALIARLRHQIVHRGGWTDSKDKLICEVAEKIGRCNGGKVPEELSSFARGFFGAGQYENMVALREVPAGPNGPVEKYVCRWSFLLEVLMGYGHVLVESVRTGTATLGETRHRAASDA